MNFLKITTILLTLFSCSSSKTRLNDGIYHYLSPIDTTKLISRTIRLNANGTFVLYGMERIRLWSAPSGVENFKYISMGTWNQDNMYLKLNTYSDEFSNHHDSITNRDRLFYDVAKWDYAEAVVDMKNDSFLITDNGKKLKTVKDGIILEYQPGK